MAIPLHKGLLCEGSQAMMAVSPKIGVNEALVIFTRAQLVALGRYSVTRGRETRVWSPKAKRRPGAAQSATSVKRFIKSCSNLVKLRRAARLRNCPMKS